MNVEEVSAFAAYGINKNSEKLLMKKKLKNKLKKKKKKKTNSYDDNYGTNNFFEVAEFSSSEDQIQKKKIKLAEKKELMKPVINNEEDESIFKPYALTDQVDNEFFKENGISASHPKKKKKIKDGSKKAKKRELMNGNQIQSTEISESKNGSTESTILKSDFEFKSNHKKDKESNEKVINKIDNNKTLPNLIHSDSVKVGEEVFLWMISPITMKDFFDSCWEKKPLHIKRNNEKYFNCICTLEDFKTALMENDMYFTKNIDVTSYINGQRVTENPEGKATPSLVWDFFNTGRSIRLLNPQTFIRNIRMLNSTLQEFFHCFVGANIYLTPAGTQGFAPHYDDIEAFVLQLEGEKLWKLYNPRSPEEVLPRESSRNFEEHEIGEPFLEVTLQPGDLLYFPRGVIHQAKCLPHIHSLHITVSCYQKNSWADLFEKIFPVALQKAITEDVEFRKGLPIGYLNSLGMVNSDKETDQRLGMVNKFKELFQKVVEYCPLDAGVDQLGGNYTHDALPPFITDVEKAHGADRNCKIENFLEILTNYEDKTLGVKLIRATSIRLVAEEEEMVLYYTTDNSLVYHEHGSCSVNISTPWAQAVEYLIHSYPKFVEMRELPVTVKVNKPGKWKRIVEFVYFLWQKGLVLFDRPFEEICS